MKYLVKISPALRHQSAIVKLILRIIGPTEIKKAKELATKGGIVIKNLNKDAANNLANQFSDLGAQVEVEEMNGSDSGATSDNFQVKLTHAGRSKLATVKLIKEFSGLGLKEAKELVDKLGVVANNLSEKEAIRLKERLERRGARVEIVQVNSPKPEPELRTFGISGTVTNAQTQPLSGLKVNIFYGRSNKEKSLGEVNTNHDGEYSKIINEEEFPIDELEKTGSYVIIKVFDQDQLVGESPTVKTKGRSSLTIDVAVEAKEDDSEDKPFRVYGTVRNEYGEIIKGVTVKAFDRDLRSEQLLGESKIENDIYNVLYSREQFKRAEKEYADIVVKVINERKEEIHKTPIHYNAPKELEVNINLKGGEYKKPSEWEVISDTLTPLLENISPLDLREDEKFQDISFLSGESGQSQSIIGSWIISHHLEEKAKRLNVELKPSVFFGYLRQGQPNIFYYSIIQDINEPDRAELVKDKILKELSRIDSQLQKDLLEKALSGNIIPAIVQAEVDAIMEKLHRIHLHYTADKKFDAGKGSMGDLLNLTSLSETEKNKFLAEISDYNGPIDEFWKKLDNEEVFENEKIKDIKLNFELGTLTQNYIPLVWALHQKFKKNEIQSKRELAKYDRESWIKLLKKPGPDGEPIAFPSNIDGETEEEKYLQYAVNLEKRLERYYPTTSFATKLQKSSNTSINNKNDIVRFLEKNPKFHLDRFRVDQYLSEKSDALEEIEDKENTLKELKAVQRVFKLSPTFNSVEALLKNKIDSAQQVYFMGKEQFSSLLKDSTVNKFERRKIFNKSVNAYAEVVNLFSNFNRGINGIVPKGANTFDNNSEIEEKISALPNLKTLFGSLDYCECSHCRSVYSPAAYFVDILNFLSQRNTQGNNLHAGKKVSQVLLERRPDLGEIELSCENTNTPIPYIDLVNEILEDEVSLPTPIKLENLPESELTNGQIKAGILEALKAKNLSVASDAQVYERDSKNNWVIRDKQRTYKIFKQGSLFQLSVSKQTHLSSAELRANPEYTNPAAYNKLAEEIFPCDLPFSLWNIQSRAYLEHLGVPQPYFFELFQHSVKDDNTNPRLSPSSLQIENAWLGLNGTQQKIITGSSDRNPWELWGLKEASNDIPHPEKLTDPTANISGDWIEVLSHVPLMLHRAGIKYKDLLQLLDTAFINPSGTIFINTTNQENAANCDIDQFKISGLTSKALSRIQQFIRLWRKISCQIWELDLLLSKNNWESHIGDKQLSENVLQDISQIVRIRTNLDLDWPEVKAFYSNIDNTSRQDYSKSGSSEIKTLYQQLFRNKLVDSTSYFPENPELITGTITNNISSILGAFRLSETELNLILSDFDPSINTDNELTWDILSQVFRRTVLCKTLNLTVEQFIILKELWEKDPFEAPRVTLEFISLTEKISKSAFTLQELSYLLSYNNPANYNKAAENDFIISATQNLREGLIKLIQDIKIRPEENKEAYTQEKLELLPTLKNNSDRQKALAIIKGEWEGIINEEEVDNLLEERKELIASYFDFLNEPDKLAKSLDEFSVEERLDYFQPKLEAYLIETQKEIFIKQYCAEIFGIQTPIADLILSLSFPEDLPDPSSPGELLELSSPMEELNNKNILEKKEDGDFKTSVNESNFPGIFYSMRLLYKHSLLINKLKINFETYEWWLSDNHAIDMGWPQASDFSFVSGGPITLDSWLNMVDFLSWKKDLGETDKSVFDFLNQVLNEEVDAEKNESQLAELAGWEKDNVVELIREFDWDVKIELKKSASLKRLRNCMLALNRLGVNASLALSWADAEPDVRIAESLKHSIKAKYDLDQWQEVIKPLQDTFREQKRDALVNWLIANPDKEKGQQWSDMNGLYSYFLIDVGMSSCMLSSRLKQAASSVQLFVQRCLMNLENDIIAKTELDSKWKQWKWMKNYRVWEANRKVFLFPENLLEPELRDEKSPFFKDLENELKQNETNKNTAELAYLNYLEKLDQVSNLEIRAMYEEVISEDESILHVFGRTRGSQAPDYFYRKRINGGRWTAWERIDLDIKANHLMVGIHNRRLHLLWPQFLEKAEEPEIKIPKNEPDTPIQKAKKYWEISLFWSEMKKGKWTPKVLSNSYKKINHLDTGGNKTENISFRTRLKPFIVTRLYYSSDPKNKAPKSEEDKVFHKYGKQIETNVKANNKEQIITAHNSQYSNNLLRNNKKDYYFYFSLAGEQRVSSATRGIKLLRNIKPELSYTVIDSKAGNFSDWGSFFFWDNNRTYFIDYDVSESLKYYSWSRQLHANRSFNFYVHYHPYVDLFIKELNIHGIKGFLNRRIQTQPQNIPGSIPAFDFTEYQPTNNVKKTFQTLDEWKSSYPSEDVDFSYKGAYALYNWELFFHAPFFIANKLAANQRFEEALEWYHYIFDPTNPDNTILDPDTPQQKYWITKPFYETTKKEYYQQKIENLLLSIAKGDNEARIQVKEWRDNPFNPHLIARMRTVAYQKNVLIKYIQTLIAWGDQLFSQNTMESINEATQLYILADSVLGPRPKSIPKKIPNPVKTYYQLEKEGIGDFSNAIKEIEGLLPSVSAASSSGDDTPELPRLNVMYFCIPNNEKLLSMWDTVADRIFKIRHCMNIEGVVQQLPLFAPPIDPAALVNAAAAGLDLGDVLSDMNSPMPLYRFNFMHQKALGLANEVRSFGGALLTALEKKDAEEFTLLRSTHEIKMMDAAREVKNKQVEEALMNLESLKKGKKIIEGRKDYYQGLIDEGWIIGEHIAFDLSVASNTIQASVAAAYILSGGLKLVPKFLAGAAGFGGTPEVSASMGGQEIGGGAEMAARTLQSIASTLDKGASLASTAASYYRRSEEWEFQKLTATKELAQIDKQIAAAEIRYEIVEKELLNHDKQKENLDKEYEYMRSKFTNKELYDWMVNQLSTLYFQNYQLAFDVAKQAERCFKYELVRWVGWVRWVRWVQI